MSIYHLLVYYIMSSGSVVCTSFAPSDTLGHCGDDQPDQLLRSTLIIPLMSFQSVWPTHKHSRAVKSCTFLADIMDHLLTQEY